MRAINFIAGHGAPAASGDEYERRNPADEREVVGKHPRSGPADVTAAIEAAESALPGWTAFGGPRRAAVLHAAATLLEAEVHEAAVEIVLEEGKTLAEAHAEVMRTIVVLRHFAERGRSLGGTTAQSEEIGTTIYTRHRPVGIVACITPWNFPLALPAWKAVPAIGFGNTVVLKPAQLAPAPAIRLARVLHEAGLPPGVLNVVIGSGSDVGDALVDDTRIAAVSFTGSNSVGQALARRIEGRGARFQAELGGQSPAIVLDDADPVHAARLIAESAFGSAGQRCTATRRVIVEAGIYEAVASHLQSIAARLEVGPGMDDGVSVPPMITSSERDTVLVEIDRAEADGAELLVGGIAMNGRLAHGGFMSPTLLGGVTPEMHIAREEVFGPVCSLLKASGLDQAIEMANDVRYGLSASIMTRDLGSVIQFVERVDAGMIHVNRPTIGGDPHMPFGGVKDSGSSHREWGEAAAGFFTEQQTVYVRA